MPPAEPDPILSTVAVPEPFRGIFLRAQQYVQQYFSDRVEDPHHSTIAISGERYILVRAASMSVEFFDLVLSLYRDKEPAEARRVASNLLFDVAHAIGKADARSFHARMQVSDPIERLSAGPIHFSFSGWAFVNISPASSPTPDENYYLIYDHPYSFEAASWMQRGRRVDFPVCIMNAGYSSGWCEESFGIALVAAEVHCQACGDAECRFIMAPPHRIEEHLARYRQTAAGSHPAFAGSGQIQVPVFFERKRMEDALRQSETRFRTIFENAGIGIALLGMSGELLEVNPQFERLLGYSAQELRGRALHSLADDDDLAAEFPLYAELAAGRRAQYQMEKQYRHRGGHLVAALLNMSLVRGGIGEPQFAIAMIEDMTSRKAADEKLRKSEKLAATGRLAATIAHEINNPLAAVANLLFLARSDPNLSPETRGYLEHADQELRRVAIIARQTLGFYREASRPAPVDVCQMLQEIASSLDGKLKARNLALERRFDESQPVEAIAGEVRQLLANLLSNAIDASPEGGRIVVHIANRAGRGDSQVGLAVVIADGGCGIDPAVRRRIFEPFFTTKKDVGTGLGLWVCSEIVHKHGGRIQVRSSQRSGRSGTAFKVFLPARMPAQALANAMGEAAA